MMDRHERLFSLTLRACAPLLVWAAHFTFCYLYAAVSCGAGAWAVQAAASALALALVAWMLWRGCRAAKGKRALRAFADAASAALALAGVAWTTMVLLLSGPCALA
ncbi:hypothetical protein [Massilia endophytica]|uniref:hypothetical protein n=1 Tax=Massilia endophytica TaxID=2899220 RepID=UPI001E5168D7|nr:hypothetical protein [Massilia endophytica]UGQ48671.1 hypothetical protein LSQ66_09485 [Massilia endophytica]